MNIGKMKLISKEEFEKMEEQIFALREERFEFKVHVDNLNNVIDLLNERIAILEDRNKDLILENNTLRQEQLKEVKHE